MKHTTHNHAHANSVADNLTRKGGKWEQQQNTEVTLTYSFLSPGYNDKSPYYGFTQLSSLTGDQRNMVSSVLEDIAKQTGLEFRMARPGEHSDLSFGNYHDVNTITKGFAWVPVNYKPGVSNSPVWLNTHTDYNGYNAETYKKVVIHEVLHALGLEHLDGPQYTYHDSIMAPFLSTTDKEQPGDILALQKLYGKDTIRQGSQGSNHNDHYHATNDNTTVNYAVMKGLYDSSTGAKQASILDVWYKLNSSNYDTRVLTEAEKGMINPGQHHTDETDTVTVHVNVDSDKTTPAAGNDITVKYEDIKSLYHSARSTDEQNTIRQWWDELHQSEYKVDSRTLTASQKTMLDSMQKLNAGHSIEMADSEGRVHSVDTYEINMIVSRQGGEDLQATAGKDVFKYTDTAASTSLSTDTLRDFTAGQDKIDISSLASLSSGKAISFSGQLNRDTGKTEVHLQYDAQNQVNYVSVDVEQGLDLMIKVTGQEITASDFII